MNESKNSSILTGDRLPNGKLPANAHWTFGEVIDHLADPYNGHVVEHEGHLIWQRESGDFTRNKGDTMDVYGAIVEGKSIINAADHAKKVRVHRAFAFANDPEVGHEYRSLFYNEAVDIIHSYGSNQLGMKRTDATHQCEYKFCVRHVILGTPQSNASDRGVKEGRARAKRLREHRAAVSSARKSVMATISAAVRCKAGESDEVVAADLFRGDIRAMLAAIQDLAHRMEDGGPLSDAHELARVIDKEARDKGSNLNLPFERN